MNSLARLYVILRTLFILVGYCSIIYILFRINNVLGGVSAGVLLVLYNLAREEYFLQGGGNNGKKD